MGKPVDGAIPAAGQRVPFGTGTGDTEIIG